METIVMDEILKTVANQAPSLVVLVLLVSLFLKHMKEQGDNQTKALTEFRTDLRENTNATNKLSTVIARLVGFKDGENAA